MQRDNIHCNRRKKKTCSFHIMSGLLLIHLNPKKGREEVFCALDRTFNFFTDWTIIIMAVAGQTPISDY